MKNIIRTKDMEGLAEYLDKHPELCPKLNDTSVDPKEKIISMLREYDAK